MPDIALRKIVSRQTERDETDLARIDVWLAEYEAQYQMKSADFWQKFKAGGMQDIADFMEWNALCRSKERLARLSILRGNE